MEERGGRRRGRRKEGRRGRVKKRGRRGEAILNYVIDWHYIALRTIHKCVC